MPDAGRSGSHRLYEFAQGVLVRFMTDRRDVLSHFDREYGRLAVASGNEPQIDVHVGRYARLTKGADFLTHQGRHKTITWKVAFKDLDGDRTTVAFEGKGAMAISFLQTFYLEPLLRLKLLQAGYALVHGCAVVKEDRAVLLPGTTGVGKTTLALQQAIAGRAVQGDNYVILGRKGETHPFPRRLRIYSDLSRTNLDAYLRLPLRERLHLRLFGLIKRLSLGYANMPRRLSIEQFVPSHRPSYRAELDSVFLLTSHGGSTLVGPNPLPLDELVEKVQAISRSEGSRLAEAIGPFVAAHPESPFPRAQEMEKEILVQALRESPAFEILVPRVSNPGPLAVDIARACGLDGEPVSAAAQRR